LNNLRCFFLVLLLIGIHALAQKKSAMPQWIIQKPFEQNCFIENIGQLNSSAHKGEDNKKSVLYYTSKGKLIIFYTHDSIIFHFDSIITNKENKAEHFEEEGRETKAIGIDIGFKWIGATLDSKIEVENQLDGYYTYSGNRYRSKGIIAHAYKTLIYRNLYKGIDVEFFYPIDKGGLKYNIIVHPGADISAYKMQYTGAGVKLSENNVIITSPLGTFIDHAPTAVDISGNSISSSFTVENNIVSLQIANYDKSKTLNIDPWISSFSFNGNSAAYDIDYDNKGNVYIYGGGGTTMFELMKYNSVGKWQWTYTPTIFTRPTLPYYGGLTVDHRSGTSYLVEGFDPIQGSEVVKVNNLGTQIALYPGDSIMHEMWRVKYDYCNNQLVIGGGSPLATWDTIQACVMDSSLKKLNMVNILGAPTNEDYHDISLLALDGVGDAYMASARSSADSSFADNVMLRMQLPSLLPAKYNVSDGYSFREVRSMVYYPYDKNNNIYLGNGFNGIVANGSFMATYDGATLKTWRSSTGSLLNTISISNTSFNWGGIDMDCQQNIYLANNKNIVVLDSTLTTSTTLTTFPDPVYDIKINGRGQLFACGYNFVGEIYVPNSKMASASFTPSVNCSACNATATVNACGPGPFSFKWSNGDTTQTITGLCPGNTYSVTVYSNKCEPRQDTAIVTIPSSIPGFNASIKSTNPTCIKRGSAIVNANGGAAPYTYLWSDGSTNQTDTGMVAGAYTVVVTDNNGCIYYANTTLVNPSPPVINFYNPDSLCFNRISGGATMTAYGAKTYTWAPASGLSCTNCNSTFATPTVTTIYTVTATDSLGCVTKASVTVINPHVTVSPQRDSICEGSSVSLLATGATSYTWSPPIALSCTSCPNPVSSPTTTTIYNVTGYQAGCASNAIVIVDVFVINNNITINAAKKTICKGSSVLLTAVGGSGYIWSPAVGLSCTACQSTYASPTITTTYTVQNTGVTGCNTATIVINVLNSPTVTVNSSNDTICSGNSVLLTAAGGNSYTWSPSVGLSCTNCANPIASPASTTTYTLVGTNTLGCTKTVTATVDVFTTPTVVVNPAKDSICMGNSVAIMASGGAGYIWSPTSGLSCNVCPNPIASPTITTIYTVTANNGPCSADTTITISNLTKPNIGLTGNLTICEGRDTTLIASGGGTYLWNTGATTNSIQVAPLSSSTYSVLVTASNGCSDSASLTVSIDNIALSVCCDTNVVKGSQVNLSASGAFYYVWAPAYGLNCSTCATLTLIADSTVTYTVTGIDSNGCMANKDVTINVKLPCADFTVPNVFTPNGDNQNDKFVITIPYSSSYLIIIYDRWGNEVFKSDNINQYWDGRSLTGANVADGVYYYIIKSTCGAKSYDKRGFVELLR